MAGGGGQQQQQSADNSLSAFWVTALVFVSLAIIWFYFKAYIIHGFFLFKTLQVHLLGPFFGSGLDEVLHFMRTASTDSVTVAELFKISDQIGRFLRYPAFIILLIFGVMMLLRSNSFRYRTTLNMKKLLEKEKEVWPQIAPISKLNLVKKDIDEGPWAMSTQPLDFAKKHDLVKLERKARKDDQLSSKQRPVLALRRGQAHRVFAMQLGKPWEGVEKLSMPTKALFAIFAAKGAHDDKSARQLISQIAASTQGETGKLDFSGVDALIKKYGDNKRIKMIVEKHAYVLTVMASMIEYARDDGVLATADFIWLKPINRPLWYMLSNVGRQTAFPEVAGPFAHWLAEKALEKKIVVPMVEEAVIGMGLALKDILYEPDEHGELEVTTK